MNDPIPMRSVQRRGDRGQVIVIAALAIIGIVAMTALVLEGGNAYAQQRVAQNSADAVANAGAVVLAERLGGATKTDADVASAVANIASANGLGSHAAHYTSVKGQLLNTTGSTVTATADAAAVGGGTIPPGAQGVQANGTRSFATFFARAIGINSFDASALASAVTGRLNGGAFLPVVFPVNIVNCEQNGSLGVGEESWILSDPPTTPGGNPNGQEYIVPLCKTGGGSFMILDLDGTKNNCDDEVTNPPAIQLDLPTDIATDNGNNCAKKMVDEVNALHGHTVLIPICDAECITAGGSKGTYHIIKVAAFHLDYMSDSNNKNNPDCQDHGGLIGIGGNGSSSCIAGWFVRYITQGPVGPGAIGHTDAIGVQLIR